MEGLARAAYERRIQRLETEKKELSRKLVETSKTLQETVHGPGLPKEENQNLTKDGATEAQLREELAVMTKKAAEMESLVRGLEGSSEEAVARAQETERQRGDMARAQETERQRG